MITIEQTDEQIQAMLAGTATQGPRTFQGKPLANWTLGLRDLLQKVVADDDTGTFLDVATVCLCTEAHSTNPNERLLKRAALIAETDNVTLFRGKVSLLIDDLDQAGLVEANRLANEILSPVKAAEVSLLPKLEEKKSEPGNGAELSPTTTPLPSGLWPELPGGPSSTSAGS